MCRSSQEIFHHSLLSRPCAGVPPVSPNCTGFPHGVKPTAGYWIECKGGTKGVGADGEDKRNESSPTPSESRLTAGNLRRGMASSENLFIRKLERSDTSKSTSNMEPMSTLHPPTIQIIDSSHKTKDDLELYRKHGPNIIITMPQSALSTALSPGAEHDASTAI